MNAVVDIISLQAASFKIAQNANKRHYSHTHNLIEIH